jgi:hypothetical protein
MQQCRLLVKLTYQGVQIMTQGIAQPTTHQAYELDHDISHLVGDLEYDAWLIKPSEYENILDDFWEPRRLELPEGIEFDGDGERLLVSDYPYVKERWPIMSKRMLNTLLAVQDFPYQAIPVIMKDIFVPPQFEENHDFVAVQLLEHQDVFDWESSVCESDPERSDIIIRLDSLVLRIPQGGLPPLFRIAAAIPLETRLFVSAEVRSALEQTESKGIRFIDLEYVRRSSTLLQSLS